MAARLRPENNSGLASTEPVVAEFSLNDDDRAALGAVYGLAIPEGGCRWGLARLRQPARGLDDGLVTDAAKAVAATVGLADEDLAALKLDGSLADAVAKAKALAKEHRDAGETARAKLVTSFASQLETYDMLVTPEHASDEQLEAVWRLIPRFFYFSNYDTLSGETNLTELAAKIQAGSMLKPSEQTVVALLAHAGEKPSDFLDPNYASRKAELQSASFDLSRRVFKYWKQNTDLTVIFDTDNRVVRTDPQGNETADRFLMVELRDGRHGDVETNFDTRSTGFQWFFSFFAAFSEYQDSDESVIVLLDEPGTRLHGDAQHEFVDYIFNELGASKQTIYTTHSQHMVDPTRYEKLRAVHDRATRDNPDLGVAVTPPSLSTDRATILPIESALGYSVSQHLFLGSGQHLAVEGSGDFVYLQRFTDYLTSEGRAGLDPRLSIIPVGGADNMPAFVALLGRRLKVSALIDGARSNARLNRIKAAAKDNGVPESAIVVCSDVDGLPTNADIEDLFTVTDYLRLYNWTFGENLTPGDLATTSEPILKKLIDKRGGTDFDHALPAHELTKRRDEFLASVEPKTVDNFEALFTLLNATVQR